MTATLPKYSWQRIWLGIYAVGCVLVPPLHFHEKYFFAAEYLLAPLVFAFFWKLIKKRLSSPPRILIAVIIGCTLAFLSGLWRRDIGKDIGVYYNLTYDQFSLSKDGISFVRWCLIFATPYLVASVFRSADDEPRNAKLENIKQEKLEPQNLKPENLKVEIQFFWTVLKGVVFISAVLALFDHENWISLQKWGYHEYSQWWIGRSNGTQSSPLEASLIYGGMGLYAAAEDQKQTLKMTIFNVLTILACGAALAFTQSFTAIAAAGLTFVIFFGGRRISQRRRIINLAVLAIIGVVILLFLPHLFLLKVGDMTTRTVVWVRYFKVLLQKPWLLLTGIGFSGVVVDNSIMLLFIKGGLFLLLSVGAWMTKLYRFIPPSFRSVYFFWGLSFLALDSIGYWALGRILWFSLGLFYSSRLVTDSAPSTRNSAPRGSTPS